MVRLGLCVVFLSSLCNFYLVIQVFNDGPMLMPGFPKLLRKTDLGGGKLPLFIKVEQQSEGMRSTVYH